MSRRRVLLDVACPFSDAVRDVADILIIWTTPQTVRAYVTADWKVSEQLEDIEDWLDVNKRGKAILVTTPMNLTEALPARCLRARDYVHALRVLRSHLHD